MAEPREVPTDEPELMARAREGDTEAFATLVSRHQGPVYRYCLRLLGAQEAEDAAQETFVRALVHRQRFDPTRPLLPWLFTIARNLCVDRLRKHRAEPDPVAVERGAERAAKNPDREAAAREELGQLQAALRELPDGQREAILRFHLEGMSYAAVAESLEVPIGTVMTWIHRGRERLRELVAPRAHSRRVAGVEP